MALAVLIFSEGFGWPHDSWVQNPFAYLWFCFCLFVDEMFHDNHTWPHFFCYPLKGNRQYLESLMAKYIDLVSLLHNSVLMFITL